ncbi:MAG TPA: DUF378 domain-containing protein [Phycisphaerales bacterium]|nr:DUF378 domain-containing protein [Phycisphaerales bacterium]
MMGFFGLDPVAMLLGSMTRTSKLVYSLICLAAFYDLLSMLLIGWLLGWTTPVSANPLKRSPATALRVARWLASP